MDSVDKQEILLDAGTNELEVLVFSLGRTRYGVNVAKVREVIGQVDVVTVPMTPPEVVGVFNLRDSVIPLIDLQLYFDASRPSEVEQRTVILMEFNDISIGFLVDTVERIYRLSWGDVKPMPGLSDFKDSIITSVCEVDEKLALMVDFEKIAFDINDDNDIYNVKERAEASDCHTRAGQHILLAEDSPTIRNAIEQNLVQAGFGRVTAVADGEIAWGLLSGGSGGAPAEPFTFVVTDIEMPRMDGLHLCKRIKDSADLGHLPVVVFSSLVSDTNLKKVQQVGADAALTKPQMTKLVELIDGLLAGKTAGEVLPDHVLDAEPALA